MPRRAKTDDEKQLEQQVRDLITSIKSKDAPAIDLPRAIRLFETAQNSITKALAILRGEEVENPNRIGRPRKSGPSKAERTGILEGVPNLFDTNGANAKGTTAKRMKGAATTAANS